MQQFFGMEKSSVMILMRFFLECFTVTDIFRDTFPLKSMQCMHRKAKSYWFLYENSFKTFIANWKCTSYMESVTQLYFRICLSHSDISMTTLCIAIEIYTSEKQSYSPKLSEMALSALEKTLNSRQRKK